MTMIILDTNVISEILKKDHADRRVIDWFIRVPMNEATRHPSPRPNC